MLLTHFLFASGAAAYASLIYSANELVFAGGAFEVPLIALSYCLLFVATFHRPDLFFRVTLIVLVLGLVNTIIPWPLWKIGLGARDAFTAAVAFFIGFYTLVLFFEFVNYACFCGACNMKKRTS